MSKDITAPSNRCYAVHIGEASQMTSQLNNPEYWGFRAEEVRTIADDMNNAETKAIMARIAEDYERIGKIVKKLAHDSKQQSAWTQTCASY